MLSRLVLLMLAGATSALSPPSELPADMTASRSMAVANMVSGIMNFSRWPPPPSQTIRLCVVGPASFAGKLNDEIPSSDRPIKTIHIPLGNPSFSNLCDALYVGGPDNSDRRRLFTAVQGQPILTIAEDDPTCRSGAMFCLHMGQALSFELNLDAVSRSRVAVDPRVLRLSREKGDAR